MRYNTLSLTTHCLSLQHIVSHHNTLSLTTTHCLSLSRTIINIQAYISKGLSAGFDDRCCCACLVTTLPLPCPQCQECRVTCSVSGGACNADLVGEADCCSGVLPLLVTPPLSPLVLLCLATVCTGTVVAKGGAMGGRLEDVTKVAEANVL